MDLLLSLLLDALFSGVALWLASKVLSVQLRFTEIVIAVFAASLVALLPVPILGWVLSLVVLFYLLKHFSDADVWPDLILLVLIGRLISFLAILFLVGSL
ncbi:hypothetical protein [Aliamphritea spongicola]|uniref:hypothetical protein n=1 Tax=Aliamphritea spongicola TaxID=707589 RepID=UPI00196AAD78|nr:hypothetical protein [Aliamphritea spongicola]MBN3562200.1 hypothetical protein [Aliamphritea spongicola]